MSGLIDMAIAGASLLLAIATGLSFIRSNAAWIRIWDFPRQQIAMLLVLVLLATLWLIDLRSVVGAAIIALSCIAFGCQAYRIWPYTPLHSVQAEQAQACPRASELRLLVANVLRTNRQSNALFRHIRELQPDIVFLNEINAWWARELQQLHSDYPYRLSRPQDRYGIYLMSRLPLLDGKVRQLVDDHIPSIKAGVKLKSGETLTLYGLHPPPPPLHHTAKRDAELTIVAREARQQPSIVFGDLNDVAWSRTTHLFQEISGLLDPRIGRGFYPTYNANWWLLRWPLDHVFFHKSFLLRDLRVLGHIGSDHYPLFISLCHRPVAGARQDAPEAKPADRAEARKAIEQGRQAHDEGA